jgi:hypothetical protein
VDGKIHLFILEGLADQGSRQLWESHQSRWVDDMTFWIWREWNSLSKPR